MRVNASRGETSIRFRINLAQRPSIVAGVTLPEPDWNIRITQLECPRDSKTKTTYFDDIYKEATSEADFEALGEFVLYYYPFIILI